MEFKFGNVTVLCLEKLDPYLPVEEQPIIRLIVKKRVFEIVGLTVEDIDKMIEKLNEIKQMILEKKEIKKEG
jgi:hypothetical protein